MEPAPKLELLSSRHFNEWLAQSHISLAFTTYQSGKLFLIGLQDDGRLSIFERTFNRAMGLTATPQTLYLSTLYQVWRFENSLEPGQLHEGYDRYYVPQVAWTTGEIDVHDMALDAGGRLVFVCTLFGCLATVSERYSFVPLWRPPFVSRLAPEDRCHLNGLAMCEGEPRYVTSVSRSDVNDGWREHRRDGGVVVDVRSGDTVLGGLSMPHSPRCYRERLWLHDSGNGSFGYADLERGRFEAVAFCPGYLRGMDFYGDYAVVGLSRARGDKALTGLPLDDHLRARGAEARCALQVIDLRSGNIVHWLRIDGIVQELYDVAVLPGVRRPTALGLRTEEIQHTISVGPVEALRSGASSARA